MATSLRNGDCGGVIDLVGYHRKAYPDRDGVSEPKRCHAVADSNPERVMSMAGQSSERLPYQPTSRSVVQFSLTALFILTTLFALGLSAFIGISQFFEISPWELLSTSFTQCFYLVPRLVIWSVGLAMAVRRRRTHRKPAFLTAIALTGFIVTTLLATTVQMAVIAGMDSGRFAGGSISWVFAAIGVFYAVMDAGCWILILMAIFSGRPTDCRPFGAPTDIHDPFSDEEPITAGLVDDEETPLD